MNENRIAQIIEEEIRRLVNEDFMGEKNKLNRGEPKKKLLHKMRKGKAKIEDLEQYRKDNRVIPDAEADAIRNKIDVEKTNMAAIARILFPHHTDEGAQSQFRKIINGERPMTRRIALKIDKLIASGKIAVK